MKGIVVKKRSDTPILLKRFDSEEDKSFVLIKIVETESLLFTEHGVEELN